MREYVLLFVLCIGCLCSADYDDYGDFIEEQKNYENFNYDDQSIETFPALPVDEDQFKSYEIEDNRSDQQLKENIEKYMFETNISNEKKMLIPNDVLKKISDETLYDDLDAKENKEDSYFDAFFKPESQASNDAEQALSNTNNNTQNENNSADNTDNNLEDIKFEGTSVVSNQTEFDKIMADTRTILAEADSSDMENIESFKGDELNTKLNEIAAVNVNPEKELKELYDTWEKLKSDNEAEVPDIFKNIKSQESENVKVHDIIELDENDKEHFEEVGFVTLFEYLAKDIDNENKTAQVIEENVPKQDDLKKAIVLKINDTIIAEQNLNNNKEVQDSTTNKDTKTINVKDLSSTEYTELMDQFKEIHAEDFEVEKLQKSNPITIPLKGNEIVTINSPNYPNPYPTNQIVDWMIEGDGMGIELNITDFIVNGALGDYVLFKPGGIDETGNKGLIVSYQLDQERKFRFLNVNKMFVRFESKLGMAFRRGFSFNVKMINLPTNTTEEDNLPPSVILPPAKHTLTVHLGGIPFSDFKNVQDEFKVLLADMATMYIHQNEIEAQNETSSVTRITSTNFCNINWPGFQNCVAVTFTVPVHTIADDEKDWRLNEDDLRAMWYTYIYMDPFAARLKRMGVEEFNVPDDSAILTWWMVVGTGVAFVVLALGVVLWRYSCLEDYIRMQVYNDSDSVLNEKRPLDLYPTPHQTLPPLYGDINYSWPTEKGGDTTVDMPGYNNPNFSRDDVLDFESDEEPPRNRCTTPGVSALLLKI